MNSLRKFKIAMLLVLIGIGASASLTACVFEDGWRGGHEGGHERHWR
jgi:hypothetical protein